MTLVQRFREWKRGRKASQLEARRLEAFKKIPEFRGARLDRLMTLVNSEDFSLFLEYLGLTVNEKLTILSRIDLLDDKQRIEAAKLQQQMRGLLMVYDIADYLQDLAKPKEEDNK